jgi:VirE N-terminal domain.
MNILETPVSFYEHFSDTKTPKTGTFLQVVTSSKLATKYAPLLEKIRATEDKNERSKLKKQDACFNPSGTFSERSEAGLLRHSGLLAFDIDPAQNPWLNAETAPALRDEISKLKQVAYCALSASWKGVWGVVPIEKTEYHKEHFEALKADFAGWKILIDSACSNVAHLRFWSYDPDAYLNPEATTYTKLIFPQATYTPRQSGQRWHSERPQDFGTASRRISDTKPRFPGMHLYQFYADRLRLQTRMGRRGQGYCPGHSTRLHHVPAIEHSQKL